MEKHKLSVREIKEQDIRHIVDYWHGSNGSFLISMGVDLGKLPTREGLSQVLGQQLNTPLEQKNAFCMIWEINNKAIGHCNTNPTVFGQEANMHLHIWEGQYRKAGLGTAFLKLTLHHFFEKLRLKNLFCEPYALNPAPNKTLEGIGFEFIKEYTTVPGSINFEQKVKRWCLSREKYLELLT